MPRIFSRRAFQYGNPNKTVATEKSHEHVAEIHKFTRSFYQLTPSETLEKKWSFDHTSQNVIDKSSVVTLGTAHK
jgi:hypothetical protein